MSEDPERQLSITVATAVNATAQMSGSSDDPVEFFIKHLTTVTDAVLTEHAYRLSQANFPSSTLEPFPATTQPYVPPSSPVPQAPQTGPAGPAYVPPQQPTFVPAGVPQPAVVAPAPIPGAADGDPGTAHNWQLFFTAHGAGQVARDFRSATNGQWFDNRAGKTAKAPDFKVKGNQGEQTPAVWSTDKKNPSWVTPELRNRGLL